MLCLAGLCRPQNAIDIEINRSWLVAAQKPATTSAHSGCKGVHGLVKCNPHIRDFICLFPSISHCPHNCSAAPSSRSCLDPGKVRVSKQVAERLRRLAECPIDV